MRIKELIELLKAKPEKMEGFNSSQGGLDGTRKE